MNSTVTQRLIALTKAKFNPVEKHLNLSLVKEDPRMADQDTDFNSPTFIASLFSAIRVSAKLAESVDLSGNGIAGLANYASLNRVLPNMRKLSLEDNAISLFPPCT